MISLKELGFIRVGVAVPELEVANPAFNCRQILDLCAKAGLQKVKVLLFPELSITGYSSGDLFGQSALLESAELELEKLISDTRELDMAIAVGIPVRSDNQLFNCAVVFFRGKVLGVVPKTYIPNYNEFYEKRWFSSATDRISEKVSICGQEVPFCEELLFKDTSSELVIGVEICEDIWVPIPPSSNHAIHGANVILNLSASPEMAGKADYRRSMVVSQSAKSKTAYIYASSGPSESTTDLVFGGHSMISENGVLLQESRMEMRETLLIRDIDIDRIMSERRRINSFMGKIEPRRYQTVAFELHDPGAKGEACELCRDIDPHPFVPADRRSRAERCSEIVGIQALGLARRLNWTKSRKVVLGISGGLDSTLALLVSHRAFQLLERPVEDIIGISMPGFGTSNQTRENAAELMRGLGITAREIPISKACLQHMEDIGYDPDNRDVTYENIQARERTQILMDVANQEGGLVVGTGDLSELALGWCTYNGDQMSMYAVNSGVPKTLVRHLVEWFADSASPSVRKVLKGIVGTPISPELLPPDKSGNISQLTEKLVGPYELHDFFLYNALRLGFKPSKVLFLAENAFKEVDRQTLIYWLKVFYRRFFTQQFKRSCMPDGVKVGSVCLSPRGDWRMPSDASYEAWLSELEKWTDGKSQCDLKAPMRGI